MLIILLGLFFAEKRLKNAETTPAGRPRRPDVAGRTDTQTARNSPAGRPPARNPPHAWRVDKRRNAGLCDIDPRPEKRQHTAPRAALPPIPPPCQTARLALPTPTSLAAGGKGGREGRERERERTSENPRAPCPFHDRLTSPPHHPRATCYRIRHFPRRALSYTDPLQLPLPCYYPPSTPRPYPLPPSPLPPSPARG